MQLTTHTDYSLRLLIYLAVRDDDQPVQVGDVAARYGISAHHMAKVAQTLVQLGYIHSYRGRGGGVALAMAPARINIGAVVRQTESFKLLECFGPGSTCPIDPACRLKQALGEAQQAFVQVLDAYTLEQIAANGAELRALLGGT
ncbi:RrF2 family transcriptional regulator [Salinisphaera hydrothermalis]|uniref:Transcriptional regulator n=1 Tax=Salinisphaera hydrothermalis (strain C41B8) TaxID=1304275 RepID=A0A084IJD2_SALHC|nr:Rrf2 family transcriptional regulator [Salinisphaera hydrothermalis]KEZ76816.1 transcriptional regulator [Salinisphaera hydrothermalis C41B8]